MDPAGFLLRSNDTGMPIQTTPTQNTDQRTAEGYYNVFVKNEENPQTRDIMIHNACINLTPEEQAKFDAIMLGEMFKQYGYHGEK